METMTETVPFPRTTKPMVAMQIRTSAENIKDIAVRSLFAVTCRISGAIVIPVKELRNQTYAVVKNRDKAGLPPAVFIGGNVWNVICDDDEEATILALKNIDIVDALPSDAWKHDYRVQNIVNSETPNLFRKPVELQN